MASIVGVTIGFSASGIADDSSESSPSFCGEVEQGLQKDLEKGFVNCFQPESIDFRLRDGLRDKADTECICRRKIDDQVRQINIARPD
ncbi:hypothetical protein GLT92_01160 [Nanohaloarchaea archaeon]|nr:hypothetical protein [Candidatus Nanohaloarchaea archaeon]